MWVAEKALYTELQGSVVVVVVAVVGGGG